MLNFVICCPAYIGFLATRIHTSPDQVSIYNIGALLCIELPQYDIYLHV